MSGWPPSAAGLLAAAVLIGLVFSGSPGKLAPGTQIAGVDVGGLSAERGDARCSSSAARASRTSP